MSDRIELVRAVLGDLARASEHLLDEGFAERAYSPLAAAGLRGPAGATLLLARRMKGLVPRALRELKRLPVTSRDGIAWVREPRHAAPSRRPYHYVAHNGALAPVAWELRLPELDYSAAHLAWLMYGINLLLERLAWHRGVLEREYSEAVRFREGTKYGADELGRLDANRRALEEEALAARKLASGLRRLSIAQLRASSRLPIPFPGTLAWRRLRAVTRALADPSVMLPEIVADLHDSEAAGVDPALLYQRWCGLQLVRALERLGLRAQSDPIPRLLLAGAIEFRSDSHSVTLLCEPRLASRKPPLHGLFVTHGETSPDFVLISRSPSDLRVFVLDPTISRFDLRHEDKAKYLDVVRVKRSSTVAGVHFDSTGPDRSWAAAPIEGRSCRPSSWRGSHGVVPMNPLCFEDQGVLGWLGDLLGDV